MLHHELQPPPSFVGSVATGTVPIPLSSSASSSASNSNNSPPSSGPSSLGSVSSNANFNDQFAALKLNTQSVPIASAESQSPPLQGQGGVTAADAATAAWQMKSQQQAALMSALPGHLSVVSSPDLTQLRRISFEKLKCMCVPSELYLPERSFLFGALICLRLFNKPASLFEEVCTECLRREQYIAEHHALSTALSSSTTSSGSTATSVSNGMSSNHRLNRTQLSATSSIFNAFSAHVCRLLSDWTDLFPNDFADDATMLQLRLMLERICLPNQNLKRNVLLLIKNLTVKLERSKRLTEQLNRLEAERVRRLVAGASASSAASAADIFTVCSEASTLSKQLTRIELEWAQRIEASDVVDCFLLSGGPSNSKANGQNNPWRTCGALKAYVEWFNRLSYLIGSEICLHLKRKNRARIIDFFIDVSRECINLGNFNSPMAIIAGLNLPQVRRLRRTWTLVDQETFGVLESLTGPESNFGSYRSTLKAAQWRASKGQGRVVIPFFSLFIRDLYYLWERCSDSLMISKSANAEANGQMPSPKLASPNSESSAISSSEANGRVICNGFIDFDRFLPIVRHLEQLAIWKGVDCPFAANEAIGSYLLATPILTDDSLYLASFACESADNQHEKEKYKALKSQIS